MTQAGEDVVRAALRAAVSDHGWAVSADPPRLRGMLNDVLGATADEHRGALDAVVVAAEEGVPERLRAAGSAEDVRQDLVTELQGWGMTPDRAAWVVAAWRDLVPAPTDAPPVTAPPPTDLPVDLPVDVPEADVAPAVPPPPLSAPQPTALPPTPPLTVLPVEHADNASPGMGSSSPRRPLRRVVAVAAVAVVLAGVGVAGAIAVTGDGAEDRGAQEPTNASPAGSSAEASAEPTPASTPAETTAETPAETPAATGTELVADSSVDPDPVRGTVAMGGRTSGVRLTGLAEVETYGEGEDARVAPEGGRLIAFRLAEWRGCDEPPCRSWDDLDLAVGVGDDLRALPGGKGSYVVAVPAGARSVDLVMRGDGVRQTISLLNGRPGRQNIAVLARSDRRTIIDQSFPLRETASIELTWYDGHQGFTEDRAVTIRSAQLDYFYRDQRPAGPGRAFLFVDAFYTLPGLAKHNAFTPDQMRFRTSDGDVVEARDLDPGAAVHAVFDVPADLRRGSLLLGGPVSLSAGGTPYTSTLAERAVPIRFGS